MQMCKSGIGQWVILNSSLSQSDFHRNYLRTYVERDVRTLLEVRNVAAFEKFLHLLAGRVGQIVNLDGLAGEVGVSAPTIEKRTNIGREPALFFVRDSKGFEVDALYAIGRDLRPFEIKSARTFDSSFAKNLAIFRKLAPECAVPAVVYDGESYSDRGGIRCLAYRNLSSQTIFGGS